MGDRSAVPAGVAPMDHRDMRSPVRRPALIGLAMALAVGLLPLASVAAGSISASTISAAERSVLDLTNQRRATAGLVALRLDTRLAALARDRAEYMAATDDLSHTQADGTKVFDLMDDANITWYGAGEIIAWNTAAALDYSAAFAVRAWMDSPGHKAIIMSKGYNYVGFGLAISPTTGKRWWAGVYMKGPDRSGAWVKIGSAGATTVDARSARITLKWTGNDLHLQVLTSGLRYYQVQKRTDGGAWTDYGTQTATSFARTWARGHTYDVRVRARDKAGNWGSWQTRTLKP
jgi:uncharacterized protein YkwD